MGRTKRRINRPAQSLERLCARLALPADLPHLTEALTHPSFSNESKGPAPDNQRLEFLGDAVLQLCVSELLMRRWPQAPEGQLSLARSKMVRAEALADFARRHDVGGSLLLGRGAAAAGEGMRVNVLADAVEAIIGAVYLDAGLEAARALCGQLALPTLVEGDPVEVTRSDAKSQLQEVIQAGGAPAPTYRLVGMLGPDHEPQFEVEVLVGDAAIGRGIGRSKKLAEQAAAADAMSRQPPRE